MQPYLVAIGGPSGSGKTELARRLASILDAPILSLDAYYRNLAHLPFAERVRTNYDEPQSIEHELLAEQLAMLAAGGAIAVPVYDFAQHVRTAAVHALRAERFAILEGIFALYWDEVRRLAGTKVLIEVADEICLARRMERDIRERGRAAESVIEQYAATVRPMADLYVRPTRQFADVVASGCDAVEDSARMVLAHIERGNHGAGSISANR